MEYRLWGYTGSDRTVTTKQYIYIYTHIYTHTHTNVYMLHRFVYIDTYAIFCYQVTFKHILKLCVFTPSSYILCF